ncbi:MAG: hypothetical protein WAO95_08595 [Burkholderiales bacterium]
MTKDSEAPVVERAFGAESRRQLLEEYFSTAAAVSPQNAWQHAYRLLLWIDRTTGLAHCYESDKCQPGRPWYARSLAFHDWVSTELKSPPAALGERIDWLFSRGSERLARFLVSQQVERAKLAEQQRAPYRGKGFPQPGEDPGMVAVVLDELGPWFTRQPPEDAMRRLTQRLYRHFSQENKRKNLVGEGFEDVLASLISQLPGASRLKTEVRPLLHSLPGFRPPPKSEKPRKVDLAIVGPKKRRVLVSAKWSVRADREEQFGVDFEAYARLEDAGRDFEYVLVTNEFDAARLVAACERRRQNANLFTSIVHVNPLGPLAAYGGEGRGAAIKLEGHVKNGRLMSLQRWLSKLIGR